MRAKDRPYRIVYLGEPCTLDGAPARIHDAEQGRIAEIRPEDRSRAAVQFSWLAVSRIMAKGGRFEA